MIEGAVVNEKKFNSSISKYEEVNKPNNGYLKQLQWDIYWFTRSR